MSKKSVVIMPDTQKVLENMGEQIKMARLRRNLSTELVAERAGISRATLWLRKGIQRSYRNLSRCYMLWVVWIRTRVSWPQDDEFGRRIQDMNLVTPKRAKRK